MAATNIRAVIDTNVLFEGLTKQGGACGLVIDAWLNEQFRPCVSTALEYEYVDVLSRKLSVTRWRALRPVMGLLLAQSEWVTIYYTWRPASPDPGDDLMIDCAMNAGALIVTNNSKDFRTAAQMLGVVVMSAPEFIKRLAADLLMPTK